MHVFKLKFRQISPLPPYIFELYLLDRARILIRPLERIFRGNFEKQRADDNKNKGEEWKNPRDSYSSNFTSQYLGALRLLVASHFSFFPFFSWATSIVSFNRAS